MYRGDKRAGSALLPVFSLSNGPGPSDTVGQVSPYSSVAAIGLMTSVFIAEFRCGVSRLGLK